MIISIPFLASRLEQFSASTLQQGFGIEASLFDRRDIVDEETWRRVRENTLRVAREYRPSSYTFHFPVNECNYMDDPLVRQRLWESLELVDQCGMDGLVLHSNLVYPTDDWKRRDPAKHWEEYRAFVEELRRRTAGARFWVGLENMPIHGNDAEELDPVLVFPQDFEGLYGGNVGVTWDFCHYSYTVHVARQLLSGELDERDEYPRVLPTGFLDFLNLGDHIVHYHFSAFRGVASRRRQTRCMEGVAPWEADVPEAVYREAFTHIARSRAKAVTLEIRETDYRARKTVFEVARWCRDIMGQVGTAARGVS
jgi:hypothetical protein